MKKKKKSLLPSILITAPSASEFEGLKHLKSLQSVEFFNTKWVDLHVFLQGSSMIWLWSLCLMFSRRRRRRIVIVYVESDSSVTQHAYEGREGPHSGLWMSSCCRCWASPLAHFEYSYHVYTEHGAKVTKFSCIEAQESRQHGAGLHSKDKVENDHACAERTDSLCLKWVKVSSRVSSGHGQADAGVSNILFLLPFLTSWTLRSKSYSIPLQYCSQICLNLC